MIALILKLKQLVTLLTLLSAALTPKFGAVPIQTVCKTTDVVTVGDRNQIIFTCPAEDASFTDALWMSTSDYRMMSQDTIATEEDARFQNWLSLAKVTPQTDEETP